MKRHFFITIVVIPCLLILFSTCTKEIGKPIPVPVVVVVDSCKTNIKFGKDIQPILTTYCTIQSPGGCHASGSQWIGFTNYAGFAPQSSLAITRIKNGEMPQPGTPGPKTLSACEISKLETWVSEGSVNN